MLSAAITRPRALLPEGLPACMGGWCAIREGCPRYRAQTGDRVSERLCEPGRDGRLVGHQSSIEDLCHA